MLASYARSYARTRACVRACARFSLDACACGEPISTYPGSRARVAKLVMYLTWDNRRRQVSRTRLLSRCRASRDGSERRQWQPGKKTRKAAATRDGNRTHTRLHNAYARTHAYTYVHRKRARFLCPQSGREPCFLNVTMVADKEINQSSLRREIVGSASGREEEGEGKTGSIDNV